MNGFCSKCGASLPATTGFCPKCGTPVAAGAVTPQAQYAPVQTPGAPAAYGQSAAPGSYPAAQASYPAAPPPVTKSGGGALKIILVIVAVVVVIGLIGAGVVGYGVWRVAHAVHMNQNGDGVSIATPGGTVTTGGSGGASEAELGVPVYPGAVREKGGLNMSSASVSMVMVHYSSSDSPSQVVDFYKGKMGEGTVAVATGNNDGTVLNSGGDANDRVMITVGKGTGDDAGKTTIVIMHTKKK